MAAKFVIYHDSAGYYALDVNNKRYFVSSSASSTIQQALNTLSGTVLETVQLQIKSFGLNSPIEITKDNSMLDLADATGIATSNYGHMFFANGRSNIQVIGTANCLLDGNSPNVTPQDTVGFGFLELTNTNNFLLDGVRITNTPRHGIRLVSCTSGTVRNCELWLNVHGNLGEDGVGVSTNCDSILFDSNYMHDTWTEPQARPNYSNCGGGIELFTYSAGYPRNITITNNRFEHLGEFGVGVSHHATPAWVQGINISNNTFLNMGKEAIDACYLTNSTLDGNTIDTCERFGFNIWAQHESVSGTVISNNRFTNTGYYYYPTEALAAINFTANGNFNLYKILNNTINAHVGLNISSTSNNTTVGRNDFTGCGNEFVDNNASTIYGRNKNKDGIWVSGQPGHT